MNIHQPESNAESERQADRNHHSVQEPADAADVMAVEKIAYSIAERYPRYEVEDTGSEGDLWSFPPTEHEAQTCYHSGKT